MFWRRWSTRQIHMATKTKVTRPVRANAGVADKYRRDLQRLIAEMHGSIEYWLTAAYRKEPPRMAALVAQDAKHSTLQEYASLYSPGSSGIDAGRGLKQLSSWQSPRCRGKNLPRRMKLQSRCFPLNRCAAVSAPAFPAVHQPKVRVHKCRAWLFRPHGWPPAPYPRTRQTSSCALPGWRPSR